MKLIITEEMRYRKKVVEYAIKYNNNAVAAHVMIPVVKM